MLFFSIITVANNKFISRINNEYSKIGYTIDKFVKIISEPMQENTAAVIETSAVQVENFHGEDGVVLVFPSEHIIQDKQGF